MADHVGDFLYRLCILIGALAICGTAIWNGVIFVQLHAAREAIEKAQATKPKDEALLDVARTVRRMEYTGKTAAEIDTYIDGAEPDLFAIPGKTATEIDTYIDASGYTISEIRPAQEWLILHGQLSSREMDIKRALDVSLGSVYVAIVFSLFAYCTGLVLRWMFQQPE